MTPTEAVALAKYVRAHYPHQPVDEYTADALGELLAPFPFADCREAVLQRARRGEHWCSPSDIAGEIRRLRTARIQRAGDLTPPPGLTAAQEADWLREERRRIADGEQPTRPMQLSGGRSAGRSLAAERALEAFRGKRD